MIAVRKQYVHFLFSAKINYKWFDASGGAEEFAPYERTLHYEETNSEWPEQTIRVLINCFEQPVEFMLPREIDWRVLIECHKEPAEYIHPQARSAWL